MINIYSPPSGSTDSFLDIITYIREWLENPSYKILQCGDLNMPKQVMWRDPERDDIIDKAYSKFGDKLGRELQQALAQKDSDLKLRDDKVAILEQESKRKDDIIKNLNKELDK